MTKGKEPQTRRQQVESWLGVTRLVLLIVLPGLLAAAGWIAATRKGQVKTYWILIIVFITLILAFLNVWKEIQARRAVKTAVSAKAALAGSLSQSGRPLVTLLSKVAEAHPDERRAEVKTLISRTVQICYSQSGRLTHHKCRCRSVLYLFSAPDVLARQDFDGRSGKAPRLEFNAEWGAPNKQVIELAKGEDVLLVRDVDGDDTPAYFVPQKGCEYESFLQVPVRTERRSFGFLSVDSDKAFSLTDADVGFVILMARLLASALALLDEEFPQLVHTDD
ncbi:MAG TPA: GAF domain-containing protein, partial [Pilimelia sp.]|nr:GAF domain-containing protein [Pilimelia sp.]